VSSWAIDPHVRLLGGTQRVVHAVAPTAIEAHPVRRIGRQEPRCSTVEQARHVVGLGRVPAEQAVIAELPEVAGLRARCPTRFLQGLVKVEALHVLALLAGLE
jgi:hypothetical protein